MEKVVEKRKEGRGNKILIVEDEYIIAESLKENLEDKGYCITSINDTVEKTFSSIKLEKPDLILLDINLKGQSEGLEIANQIKDIPIIFLTSNTDLRIREEAINCSPYGYIQKGNINEDFYISIDLAINKSHMVTKYKNYIDLSKKYIKQKSTELEEFMYNISHIIKGPISTIKGIVNLSSYESNHNFLSMIDIEANKLSINLNKLVKHIYITNKEIVIKEFNFNNILYETINELRFNKEYKDVNINITHNRNNTIYTDDVILKEIIYELIENGLIYNNNIEHEKWIEISYELLDHGNKQITISDNGVGLGDEIKDNIFNLFYRGNESSIGSGIGLYMAKQLAEKINAIISIKHTSSYGTAISIKFN
ncbi:MAG: hybrid sensor histidine kinase/response regulator [Cyclobacteriaceae bacterium]|nr:hybrid sensor histidine kinase/response regulator [Cyclobacteriaceae bacterium]